MPDAIIPAVTAAPPIGGPALHAFLAGAIDYAGLFPPAQLGLPAAVTNYLKYRDSSDAWALGRFVVPAARLEELGAVLAAVRPIPDSIPLTVLLGADLGSELRLLGAFEGGPFGRHARILSVELKASAGELEEVLSLTSGGRSRYVELPLAEDPEAALAVLSRAGAFGKVRTGGTSPEAFPTLESLLRFLAAAARCKVPFKATAGLHHALWGIYPLSYQPDAPSGAMYGYLNLVLAAAILWKQGGSLSPAVTTALQETVPGAFQWGAEALRWRGQRLDGLDLASFRRTFFHGFGSCSFREPIDELALLTTR